MATIINKKPVKDSLEQIAQLDLTMVKFKLMREEGWTQAAADHAELWYRRFLEMIVTHPDHTIVPPKAVDQFWHHHILDTRKYAVDCESMFGGMLHHFPYFGLRGEEDAQNLQSAFAATLRLAEATYGEAMLAGPVAAGKGASCSDCSGSIESAETGITLLPAASCSDCSGSIDRPASRFERDIGASCSDCSGSIELRPSAMPAPASASCSDCSGTIDLATKPMATPSSRELRH